MTRTATAAAWAAATSLLAAPPTHGDAPQTDPAAIGRTVASDARTPVPFLDLAPRDSTVFELGRAVFNTQWVVAGVTGAERRDGLGPLFDSAACDACHNSGSRGRGPEGHGPLPQEVVLQLGSSTRAVGGDPSYGDVLSTAATPGFAEEGSVAVRYAEETGRFADGSAFVLRVPELRITGLTAGPLDPATVLKPRLAPAIFGVGLLEAVPESALVSGSDPTDRDGDGVSGRVSRQGGQVAGRLGWEASATSVREQTGRAFARDMGLTSGAMGAGDCRWAGHHCGDDTSGKPEVGDDLLDAIIVFQQGLGVPAAPNTQDNATAARGERLFTGTGCAHCHRPRLPVDYRAPDGRRIQGSIEAYTDLLLHDLGPGLADRTVAGRIVASEWRTAPLWGHRAGMRSGRTAFMLHDGRARSVTEAILWHAGEATGARHRFTRLNSSDRDALTGWVEDR